MSASIPSLCQLLLSRRLLTHRRNMLQRLYLFEANDRNGNSFFSHPSHSPFDTPFCHAALIIYIKKCRQNSFLPKRRNLKSQHFAYKNNNVCNTALCRESPYRTTHKNQLHYDYNTIYCVCQYFSTIYCVIYYFINKGIIIYSASFPTYIVRRTQD